MKRKYLLYFDKTVARLLFLLVAGIARLRPARVEMPPALGNPPRFAVIRPGGLGDAIMCIPFLRRLRQAFPKAHVTLVCVGKNKSVFALLPYHDELVVLDELSRTLGNLWRLHHSPFDVLFDLEPRRSSSSIVAWLSGARSRVGFDTSSRRQLYTHLVTYYEDSSPESENMLRQLAVVGLGDSADAATDTAVEIAPAPREKARTLLSDAGIDAESEFLVAVSAGALKPENRWVMSEFSSLIESILAEDARARVLLVGSAVDLECTEEVIGGIADTDRVANLVAKTTVPETLAVLAACRILIACDGGIVHMAAASGCSTISLWGPSVMQRFKPAGPTHLGIKSDHPCVPCVTRERLGEFPGCPYARRCLVDIKAPRVLDAYLLEKRRLESTLSAPDRERAPA